MSKRVEEYIKNYTRNYSNEIAHWDISGETVKPIYSPWLTPDHARAVAEIAKEEVMDKAVEWMKANITKYCTVRFKERNIPTSNYPFSEIMEKDFRKYMEEKI